MNNILSNYPLDKWFFIGTRSKKYVALLKYIENMNGKIPKGTKLYHGSLTANLKFKNSEKPIFFGMNPVISVIYIGELLRLKFTNKQVSKDNIPIGYLYEYETNEDIPFYYANDINTHVLDKDSCLTKNRVCLHPQVTIRHKLERIKRRLFQKQLFKVIETEFGELSVETTIPTNYVEKLKLINTYKINTTTLLEKYDLPFSHIKNNVIKNFK